MGLLNNRLVKVGLPFLSLVIAGSFGLKEFAQLRYDFKASRNLTKEEAKKLGVQIKPQDEVTLDTEYEKISEIDTSNWENKRGPRPWEEDNELYKEAVERAKVLNKPPL